MAESALKLKSTLGSYQISFPALDAPDPVEHPLVEGPIEPVSNVRASAGDEAGGPRCPGQGSLIRSKPSVCGAEANREATCAQAAAYRSCNPTPPGPGEFGPEVVEGANQCGIQKVVAWESRLGDVRNAVVLNRPIRPALALEALVVHVLVEVELAVDAVAGEVRLRRGDAVQISVVVDARCRLDALVDHAEPDGVEPVPLEEGGVVIAEALRRGRVRRHFGDHVHAVQDGDAPLRVRDPAAGVAEGRRGTGLRDRREQGCSEGRASSRRRPSPQPAHAGEYPLAPAAVFVAAVYVRRFRPASPRARRPAWDGRRPGPCGRRP